jgi:hypothetical protein
MSMGFLERAGELQGVRVEYNHKRSTEDQSVYFLNNENDIQESETISLLIKTALSLELPGDPPKKATVGILARKWHLLSAIETDLLKQGIPYKFEGDTARGMLANYKIRKLVEQAANLIYRVESDHEFGDSVEGKIGQKLRNNEFQSASDLIKELFSAQTGERFLPSEESDFNQLCDILSEQEPSTLRHFNTNNTDIPCVVLSTIHSQKGEEFDTVIVVGMEEGNSPHEQPKGHEYLIEWRKIVQELSHATWRANITDEDLERIYRQEEKRIFYVAMTRARYNLVISNCANRKIMGRPKVYTKSSFLALSNDSNLVKEANSQTEIEINAPKIDISKDGSYMSDGRVFETLTGVLVRSKSEMLLANEFSRRGIYYEYEQPAENVMDALPDFLLPHYGKVIIEHLGLLNDAEYLRRWNVKAIKYEKEGILYLRTNEDEIFNLTHTVNRLQEQAKTWCESKFGKERLNLLEKLEYLRMTKSINIENPIERFEDGIFEVNDKNLKIIIVSINLSQPDNIQEHIEKINETTPYPLFWSNESLNDINISIGKLSDN